MKQKKLSIEVELLCLAPVNEIIWLPNNPFQKEHKQYPDLQWKLKSQDMKSAASERSVDFFLLI